MQTLILANSPTLKNSTSALVLKSHHQRTKTPKKTYRHKKLALYILTKNNITRPKIPRKEATYTTKSYNDGLQRAFNMAKLQVFFNPDMTNFITLTYKENLQDLDQALQDIKYLVKKTNRRLEAEAGSHARRQLKYIYIFEYQARGALHVHMIANDGFFLQVNKNGYNSLQDWPHGFTSVLQITDFDQNFRPYLYLFKYMRKSQRIGKSFVHTSRNLKNFHEIKTENLNIEEWDTKNQERTQHHINDLHFYFYKYYLKRAIIPPQN